jgi:hypothetical protein
VRRVLQNAVQAPPCEVRVLQNAVQAPPCEVRVLQNAPPARQSVARARHRLAAAPRKLRQRLREFREGKAQSLLRGGPIAAAWSSLRKQTLWFTIKREMSDSVPARFPCELIGRMWQALDQPLDACSVLKASPEALPGEPPRLPW